MNHSYLLTQPVDDFGVGKLIFQGVKFCIGRESYFLAGNIFWGQFICLFLLWGFYQTWNQIMVSGILALVLISKEVTTGDPPISQLQYCNTITVVVYS